MMRLAAVWCEKGDTFSRSWSSGCFAQYGVSVRIKKLLKIETYVVLHFLPFSRGFAKIDFSNTGSLMVEHLYLHFFWNQIRTSLPKATSDLASSNKTAEFFFVERRNFFTCLTPVKTFTLFCYVRERTFSWEKHFTLVMTHGVFLPIKVWAIIQCFGQISFMFNMLAPFDLNWEILGVHEKYLKRLFKNEYKTWKKCLQQQNTWVVIFIHASSAWALE